MTYLAISKNMRRNAPGPDGSMLKILLARLHKEADRLALELAGADILTMTEDTSDYLRSFASAVAGGTDEIQHNIVAQRVLDLPRQR
jgi:alkylation response protein AidB-like acyl-CoA dehydrogenase